jgi:hypothetical protein
MTRDIPPAALLGKTLARLSQPQADTIIGCLSEN